MAGQTLAVVALALLATLAGLPPSHAVDAGFGSCPTKDVVQNFDVARYMGHWYELEAYWQWFELGGKCSQAEYTLNNDTGKVAVKNTMQQVSSKQTKSIEGFAELTDPSATPAEAKLAVTFKIPVVGERKAPYWVLATDYDNFSVVYSCSSLAGLLHLESAWVLSRTPEVKDASVQQAIDAAISAAGLNKGSLLKTTQDCGKL